MQKFIKKQIGKEVHTFVVEAETFHELIMASKNLSFGDVKLCGLCNSDDLELGAHLAGKKKHKYTTIRCRKCKACLNFGQQQENPNVVYLKTKETDEKDKNGKAKKVLDWMSEQQMKDYQEQN